MINLCRKRNRSPIIFEKTLKCNWTVILELHIYTLRIYSSLLCRPFHFSLKNIEIIFHAYIVYVDYERTLTPGSTLFQIEICFAKNLPFYSTNHCTLLMRKPLCTNIFYAHLSKNCDCEALLHRNTYSQTENEVILQIVKKESPFDNVVGRGWRV